MIIDGTLENEIVSADRIGTESNKYEVTLRGKGGLKRRFLVELSVGSGFRVRFTLIDAITGRYWINTEVCEPLERFWTRVEKAATFQQMGKYEDDMGVLKDFFSE